MGIVKISDLMHENLRLAGNALSRSINAQAEHWMRVGMLAELYPALGHQDICRMLVEAELDGGVDLAAWVRSPSGQAAGRAPVDPAGSVDSAASPASRRPRAADGLRDSH